ncbi:MAG TPA: pilus assembly protein TadG-related protein [Bacillaceae bacterium]|nr:pilus assembly protein TadG-related protein [Paenibacillus bovis]HLU21210.1 pilus assembly protein TadG-related protein [Bacillaceae bacterium]
MIGRYLKNEKGNTLLVILGVLVGAIFISFIFFDFFTTFANKRVSQTGADAAALAAANEIKEVYDEKLRSEIEIRMGHLRETANEFVDEILEEISEDYEDSLEDLDEDDPIPDPPDIDMDAIWNQVLNRMDIPHELRDAVRYEWVEIDAMAALEYFFENVWYLDWFSNQVKEINEVACEAIINAEDQWTDAAKHYATKNGSDEDVDVVFKGDEFKVMVRVKKPASFITVSDDAFASGENDVYSEAEATVKTPRGIDISCD